MSDREQKCPACNGTVKVPARSRTFTLEQLVENHKVSCPARGVSRKKGEPDEEAAMPGGADQ